MEKLFSQYSELCGRPTKELHAMLGIVLLQQMEDLTDAETVHQFAFNIMWHYALNVTDFSDGSSYVAPRTLWSMRGMIGRLGIEQALFENVTDALGKLFALDPSKQRLDSVHIFSNMAHLGRIRLFVKTIRKFLVNLKRHHADLYQELGEVAVRYEEKNDGQFAVKPSESTRTLQQVGEDCYLGKGYQMQVMETYSRNKSQPKLITHIKVEAAHESDANALLPAIEDAASRGLAPTDLLADSLYGSDDNVEKAKAQGVKVVAPAMGSAPPGVGLAEFTFSEDDEMIACPQGQKPQRTKTGKKGGKIVHFDKATCATNRDIEAQHDTNSIPIPRNKGRSVINILSSGMAGTKLKSSVILILTSKGYHPVSRKLYLYKVRRKQK